MTFVAGSGGSYAGVSGRATSPGKEILMNSNTTFRVLFVHAMARESFDTFDAAVTAVQGVFPGATVETFDEGTVNEHAIASKDGRPVARITPSFPVERPRRARCECGVVTGVACDLEGPAASAVVLHVAPQHAHVEVGDAVETVDVDEDHDRGQLIALEGPIATVAWKSGVTTTINRDDLIPDHSRDDEEAGDLHDYQTGAYIRPATRADVTRSFMASLRDGGHGLYLDGGRTVFALGWPAPLFAALDAGEEGDRVWGVGLDAASALADARDQYGYRATPRGRVVRITAERAERVKLCGDVDASNTEGLLQ